MAKAITKNLIKIIVKRPREKKRKEKELLLKLKEIFAKGANKSAANKNLTPENAALLITRWRKSML